MTDSRSGLSLVELLVVVAIIGVLLALLIPAVGSARQSAQRVTCKSNIRQICLGLNQLRELRDISLETADGLAGGWSVQVLPYVDEEPLGKLIDGVRLAQVDTSALSRPRILSCPSNPAKASSFGEIQAGHFASNGYAISDVPIDYSTPWLAGPTIEGNFSERQGPHRGTYLEGDVSDATVR